MENYENLVINLLGLFKDENAIKQTKKCKSQFIADKYILFKHVSP